MIVIMAGLPGTGKSTLARRLAAALDGVVVDKDLVRTAMFGAFVDYSREQDDLSMDAVYAAVRYMAPPRAVFIDGRVFAFRDQWERAVEVARETGLAWRIVETECSDETVRGRLIADGEHPAANRTFDLYLSLKARRETITFAKLVVDTGRPIEECVKECLAYLAR